MATEQGSHDTYHLNMIYGSLLDPLFRLAKHPQQLRGEDLGSLPGLAFVVCVNIIEYLCKVIKGDRGMHEPDCMCLRS